MAVEEDRQEKPNVGMPRWLLWAFVGKLVFVTVLTIGIVWWVTSR